MSRDPQSFDEIALVYDRIAELGPGRIAQWLTSVLPEHGASALDIGCGAGRHAVVLAKHFDHVLGVDLSAPMIELARQKRPAANVTYEVGDLMDLEPVEYELVFSVGMLHHVPDLDAALVKIRSLVRPGGMAILADLVTEKGRLPKWFFRLGAVVQLFRDALHRRSHAFERFRLANHRAWLDHVASDIYLSPAEFDRRYCDALPGATTQDVSQFRVCTWTRPS
jgi:2-polyprenyl-3-methyl-5-hydroxy-6-metoxy-1,4-benzoquinol methylase